MEEKNSFQMLNVNFEYIFDSKIFNYLLLLII